MQIKQNTLTGKGKLIDHKPRARFMEVPGFLFMSGPYVGFQTAPMKQIVHVKDPHMDEVETYEIQLPWVVYIASVFDGVISNIYVYGSPVQVRHLNQALYILPLSNIYPDNKFCMPAGAVAAPEKLEDLFGKVLNIIWDSYYNRDLFEHLRDHIWNYPFFAYPKDLIKYPEARDLFDRNMGPGDVFKVWEEIINIKNFHKLLTADRLADLTVLYDDMPFFTSNQIVKSNALHYMG